MGESPIYTANSILRRSRSYIPLIQVDPVQAVRLCGGQEGRQIHVVDVDGFLGFVPGACPGFAEPDALGVSGAPQGAEQPGQLFQILFFRISGSDGEITVAGPGGQPEVRLIPFNGQAQLLFRSRADGKPGKGTELLAVRRRDLFIDRTIEHITHGLFPFNSKEMICM